MCVCLCVHASVSVRFSECMSVFLCAYMSLCLHMCLCVLEMSDADSALRERLERTRREAEYSKKKLEQQHEEAIEEHEAAKKLLERKVANVHVAVAELLSRK